MTTPLETLQNQKEALENTIERNEFWLVLFAVALGLFLTVEAVFVWREYRSNKKLRGVQHEIDKLHGDRFLTDSQRAAIKAVCSKHKGQKFRIESAVNTPEATRFGSKIYKFLQDECGWVGENHVLMTMNLGPGVMIGSGSEDVKASLAKESSTVPLASALYHAMEDSGIVMMQGGTHDANSIPKGVIVIGIGPNPY